MPSTFVMTIVSSERSDLGFSGSCTALIERYSLITPRTDRHVHTASYRANLTDYFPTDICDCCKLNVLFDGIIQPNKRTTNASLAPPPCFSLLNLPLSNYGVQIAHVNSIPPPLPTKMLSPQPSRMSSSMSMSSRRRRRRRATLAGPPGTPVKSPIASPTSNRPPTIAYLDQFELSVTATKVKLDHGKDIRYELVVTPIVDSSQGWTVTRSFKKLQEFQQKLLEVMQLGHLCHAQCPYLYSSIKGRFPKECYLYSTSSYVTGKRRHAIEECFTTLLEALRDRENHSSCSILPGTVAQEFITFLNEDLPVDHEFRWENFVSFSKTPSSSSTWYSTDGSSRSISTPTGGLSRCWQSSSDNSIESFRSVSSNNSMLDTCRLCTSDDAAKGALTTLSCGHRFHDECIVAKLNEALACPTCGHKLS